MQSWVIEIMEKFGYLGVFLMMTIENVFPPIPSEIVLPFGGFLTTYSVLTATGVMIAATLGSVIGAMILYSIGLLVDTEWLEKMTRRYGHIFRIHPEDVRKADTWFNKYGYSTVFFCRMIPLVRSLISIPAGMAHMKFSAFILLTALGSFLWNVILITAGVLLGENWQAIVSFMELYSIIIYLLLVFGIIIGFYLYMKQLRKQK